MTADQINTQNIKTISQLNKDCVTNFIHEIWNNRNFNELSRFVTDNFIDHSNPYPSVQNKRGLMLFLSKLDEFITHLNTIEAVTSFDDVVTARICIHTTSKPNEKDAPKQEVFKILRIFRMCDNRIAEHWEVILDFQKN